MDYHIVAAIIPVITIDGPAAAGKGAIACALAKNLKFHYLDSGKIYRAIALSVLQNNIAADNTKAVLSIATQLADNPPLAFDNPALMRPQVGTMASQVAKILPVREILLPIQRQMRQLPGLVADGRDMGSRVFTDATMKVFLTANINVRAQRRLQQLQKKQINATIQCVLADLKQRDEQDSARADSPLIVAQGSIIIDSSQLSIRQIVRNLLKNFNRQQGDKQPL